jgi:hypothetical protein
MNAIARPAAIDSKGNPGIIGILGIELSVVVDETRIVSVSMVNEVDVAAVTVSLLCVLEYCVTGVVCVVAVWV